MIVCLPLPRLIRTGRDEVPFSGWNLADRAAKDGNLAIKPTAMGIVHVP